MKTNAFEAVVDFFLPEKGRDRDASFVFDKEKVSGSYFFYGEGAAGRDEAFIFVSTSQPVSVRWGDVFEVRSRGSRDILGKGRILHPAVRKSGGKGEKRMALLRQLRGNEEDMLSGLAQEKGIKGLREEEVQKFAPLSRTTLLDLSQRLESKGQIRILSFSPLFLLSQSSFEFLCDKVLVFLDTYHKAHPDELGALEDEVQDKFKLPSRILSLALKYLFRVGRIEKTEGRLALSEHKPSLTPEEEALLDRMEEMCLEGKLQSVSLEELRGRFNLPLRRLENLLSLLTERQKIVQGKDGFLVHSRWLDELVDQIRSSGKKELSVGDFKAMTGLSRKFAIPLLELLDQMGVTRRRGATREIL